MMNNVEVPKSIQQELQEIYDNNVLHGYQDVVDNLLKNTSEGVKDLGKRKAPEYAVGSLDEDGFPTQDRIKHMMKRVLNGSAWINVVEGGVRGGKDVWFIKFYTEYLMTCSAKMHLVLGVSLEHALLTVLQSNGFGLMYTIPHGNFIRSSVDGAQRGVYKFLDIYGKEKEIHFYGNYKQDDYKKFQGFTFGSVYMNEGTNQHLNGINEAMQRTSASDEHLIIITQNPKGQANPFYTEFEKPFLLEAEQIEFIEDLQKQEIPVQLFNEYKDKIEKESKKAQKLLIKNYCAKKEKPSFKYLSDEDKIEVQSKVYKTRVYYEKLLNKAPVQDFIPITESHFLYHKSMNKILNYERGGDNPNGIFNGYDYNYFHFTIEDNLGMDEMQRNDFKLKYKKGSSIYQQRVEGIRKSSDSIVYPNFSEQNIITDEMGYTLDFFDSNKFTQRYIGIDPGFDHKTGILDIEVDYTNGIVYVMQEKLIDYKNMKATVDTIELDFLKILRNRKNRSYDEVYIDPSHTSTVNHFINRGYFVTPANNSSLKVRNKDKKYANLNQQRDIMGVELVDYGFSIKKILIHERCVNLIQQIESNEFEYNENTGAIKIKKVNDDVLDVLRYGVNTYIGGTQYWMNGGETNGENAENGVSGDEGTQNEEWNLDSILEKAQREIAKTGETIFTSNDDRSERLEQDINGYDSIFGKLWF